MKAAHKSCYYHTWSTPSGKFSAAVDETGALVGTAFGGLSSLEKRIPKTIWTRDAARLRRVARQVDEYFASKRRVFALPLGPAGTPFQRAVWTALQRIRFGTTISYGQLAATLGRPGAARAVGRANATNPICLIVPCHRVIGSDGSLTGFAFGEKIKQQLLDLESQK